MYFGDMAHLFLVKAVIERVDKYRYAPHILIQGEKLFVFLLQLLQRESRHVFPAEFFCSSGKSLIGGEPFFLPCLRQSVGSYFENFIGDATERVFIPKN